jgi:multicomponent Na+:H+ antiporter subunit C
MILAFAVTIGVLFGAGATLILSRDLLRIVVGTVLLSNAINLLLVAVGREPATMRVDPLADSVSADPLVQALTLTAIVITFAVLALLLALVIRVHTTHGTIDLDDIAEAEREDERAAEREQEDV